MTAPTHTTEPEPEAGQAKHGRPRDPHVDEAIRRAALDLLVEEGFARMSMEGVASRAGVGKAAIYRRWDSKEALVVDAVADLVSPHLRDWPHTDDIRADLEAIYRSFLDRMRGVEGRLMTAVASELARFPELAATVKGRFIACRKEDLTTRIRHAIAQGKLSSGDVELMTEVGFAVIYKRALFSDEPLSDDLPQRIVRQFFPETPAQG